MTTTEQNKRKTDKNMKDDKTKDPTELEQDKNKNMMDPNLKNREDPNWKNREDPNLKNVEDPNLKNREDPNWKDREDPNWKDREIPNLKNVEDRNLKNRQEQNLKNPEDPNLKKHIVGDEEEFRKKEFDRNDDLLTKKDPNRMDTGKMNEPDMQDTETGKTNFEKNPYMHDIGKEKEREVNRK